MYQIELILALLVAVTVLAMAARTVRVPYPILLVLGGVVLALMPAVPHVELAPELVFLLFLPPLLYIAGFDTSLRELGWPMAFALGAIVSPPDAVAATAVLRGLGVPRRLVTLLEGESLFNDATALVAYQAALGPAATASFSPAEALLRFLTAGTGGVLVGLAVGVAVA